MSGPHDARQRLEELMLERATCGLAAPDRAEYDGLAGRFPDLAADDGWELAASAADAAFAAAHGEVEQPLPPALRARLLEAARPATSDVRPASSPRGVPQRPLDTSRGAWLPWLVAAALLLAAVLGWMRAPGDATGPAQPVPTVPTLAELRDALSARPGSLTLPWNRTADGTAVAASGDVVWNDATDAGYMRFQGLEPNDPQAFQYQLWIFDAARDERYPVDGGVFDVADGRSETIVPIRAKLPVDRAFLFAVTVEPPGGVVVSSRERIALTAQEPS